MQIHRNVIYFADQNQNNYWCEQCHRGLNEVINLDNGKETKKSLLKRMRNDLTLEEKWIRCMECQDLCHQVCSLYTQKHSFICPKCIIKYKNDEFENTDNPVSSYRDASALPECNLSRAIERGLACVLSEEYEKSACDTAEVERADGLSIRVVMSLEKKHKVRHEMLSRYSGKGFPSEFPVITKCILLFQVRISRAFCNY